MTCQHCGMHYGERGHNCIVPQSYRVGPPRKINGRLAGTTDDQTHMTFEWLEFIDAWPVLKGDPR